MAKIIKPEMLQGKYINLREVTLEDASFILQLRTNPARNRYLNSTEDNIYKQIDYLKRYFTLENEWYFISENKQGKPLGTIRIYNVKGKSFTGGSWLMHPDATAKESIETDMLLTRYAFEVLGFEESVFDVRKNNKKVIRYHKSNGAKIIDETEIDYYFYIDRQMYKETKKVNYEMAIKL